MTSEKLTLKEQKQHAKENLIIKLENTKQKIFNLYINERPNGKTILYPLTQEIVLLIKTIDNTIEKLKDELKKEREK